jgi:hypothetical protein
VLRHFQCENLRKSQDAVFRCDIGSLEWRRNFCVERGDVDHSSRFSRGSCGHGVLAAQKCSGKDYSQQIVMLEKSRESLHFRLPRALLARSDSSVSLVVPSRIHRSRRNSICLFSDRCSCSASSANLALSFAGMRRSTRTFDSFIGSDMAPTN